MERKRWPWRKKSSERGRNFNATAAPAEQQQEVTPEVEAQEELRFQQWEEKVNQLNEKLVAALADAVAKETAIKQHAKVAEEAVSGWEKAEAEAAAAKRELDDVVAQKAGIEERRHRLENALKESTRQLHLVKEDSNKELQTVREELLAQRASFLESKRISEVEVRVLQMKLDGVDRENSRLKYELHLLNKELEIRAEEREYTKKAADISHRQHLDNVRKIAKLEAECQRLRGLLMRKKLPAGHMRVPEDGAARRRSRGNSFELESGCNGSPHKEIQLLADRLVSSEEETKLLKETLAKRNEELQSTRVMCARTATKLSNAQGLLDSIKSPTSTPSPSPSALESHLQVLRSSDSFNDTNCEINDDEVSCAESWASALIAELAHFKKDRDPFGPGEQGSSAEHLIQIVQLIQALVHPVASRLDLQSEIDKLTEIKERAVHGTSSAFISEFLEAFYCLLDGLVKAGATFKDGSSDDSVRLKEADGIISQLRQDLQTCEQQLSEFTVCNVQLESRLKDSEQEISKLQLHVDDLESQLQSQRKQQEDLAAKHEQLQRESKMADLRDKVCIQTSADQEENLKKEREVQVEVEVEMEVSEASEKLAECQRTIQILGKQLKALASPANSSNKFNFSGISDFDSCPPVPHEKITEPSHPEQVPSCYTPNASHNYLEGRSIKAALTDAENQIPNANYNKTTVPWEEEEEEVVAFNPRPPPDSKHIRSDHIKSMNKSAFAPPQKPKSRKKLFTRLFSLRK